ncbi:uncharacterized protein LOC106661282 [Cimex lectularius]|uniref:Peptidase S1 domain-containing protein n=1 Tax=Cimex lectularius TaxID=79782 RepID=A0A8I6RA77_CIMLE|nr:uncharacterized protein LOC106661282 [Cimex lectularius]
MATCLNSNAHQISQLFPFYVTVFQESSPRCVGTLITLSKIVTAARCCQYRETLSSALVREDLDMKKAVAVVGLTDEMKIANFTQVSRMKDVKIHSRFEMKADAFSSYDIATVKLVKPFQSTKAVRPMTIVSEDPNLFQRSWETQVSPKQCVSMAPMHGRFRIIALSPWSKTNCNQMKRRNTESDEICLSLRNLFDKSALKFGSPLVCEGFIFGFYQGCYRFPILSFTSFHNYIDFLDLHEKVVKTPDRNPSKKFKSNKDTQSNGYLFRSPHFLIGILLFAISFRNNG